MSLRPAWMALLSVACAMGAVGVGLGLSLWPTVAVAAFSAVLALAEGIAAALLTSRRTTTLEQQETRLVALEANLQKVASELSALAQAQSLNRIGGPW